MAAARDDMGRDTGGVHVAWDDAATRRAWRTYRRAGLRWLAVAVVCLLLLAGGVQLAVAGSAALLRDGVATIGTVTAVGPDEVSFDYDADGEGRSQTLQIVSGTDYRLGESVQVRYDADDPTVARLVGEPRRIAGLGPAVVVLALTVLGGVILGVGGLVRALRWRRGLARAPWQRARLRMRGTDLALTPVGGDPVTGRLRSTSRWRTKTLLDLDGHELWLVRDGAEMILRVDGVDTLFGARRRDRSDPRGPGRA